MKKFVLAIVLLAFTAGMAQADIYIKQNQHTDEVTMMGKTTPAKDQVSDQWISKDKFATHMKNQSIIMDMSKKIMYMVNHVNKSYIPMTLPVDMSEYMPAQMAQMMKSMMGSVTVKVAPNNQKKTIAKLACDGYDVEIGMMMMKMKMKVWASTAVPFDWKSVSRNMMAEMLKAQMRLSDTAVKEIQKVNGYWMGSETSVNVMGQDIRSTMEVIEIGEKSPGPNTYSVPPGYTKKDKFSMSDMQQR